MEIKGIRLGLTPEDKKIVARYLKPVAIVTATSAAKKAAGALGPKLGLKAVRIIDARLEPTEMKKIKFVVGKAKEILEKPELEKKRAKEEKKQKKAEKRAMKPQLKAKKKQDKRKKKLKKLAAKGKLPFKEKLAATVLLRAFDWR